MFTNMLFQGELLTGLYHALRTLFCALCAMVDLLRDPDAQRLRVVACCDCPLFSLPLVVPWIRMQKLFVG